MQEPPMQISLSRARRVILATQGLDGRWDLASDFERIVVPLATKLHAFARFNGCTTTRVARTTPAKIRRELQAALRASA
jgi:hypothetical protein